ncbi:molybdopterin converting factor subunit 1 [Kallotenue papyrolyticum]|uniref:molybdopterin converting factor subunit 1 n=1 Tax=Kallotenue papyrolyticum TaxID=1325125 RepID=UPI0004785498|nr:molybdopterin converting factor subunit 1 [Kallotenue papyrolyticum]
MKVRVRLFALHRDIVGTPELELEAPAGTTLGELWQRLCAQYPALAPATRSILYARNEAYADPATVLQDGDEVAFIPPVSGGAALPEEELFAIRSEPLDETALRRAVHTPQDGAVVVFSGVVRNNFAGRATDHLEYEAYASMAVPVLRALAEEARARWPIGRVAIHHRIGRLQIGETAVVVAVAAPHRRAAFEAAAYLMDRIKEVAPIWKREVWADGSAEWVGSEHERSRRPDA